MKKGATRWLLLRQVQVTGGLDPGICCDRSNDGVCHEQEGAAPAIKVVDAELAIELKARRQVPEVRTSGASPSSRAVATPCRGAQSHRRSTRAGAARVPRRECGPPDRAWTSPAARWRYAGEEGGRIAVGIKANAGARNIVQHQGVGALAQQLVTPVPQACSVSAAKPTTSVPAAAGGDLRQDVFRRLKLKWRAPRA